MSSSHSGKSHHRPYLIIATMGVLALVFIYELMLNGRETAVFIDQWAVVPIQLLTNFTAEWPTLLTAAWIHVSWLHLIGNLAGLWIIGRKVEATFGTISTAVLLPICGSAALLLQLLAEPASPIPIAGASGMVAALMGAWLGSRREGFPPIPVKNFPATDQTDILFVVFWFITQLFNGVAPIAPIQLQSGGVAFFSHVGGFVMGILIIKPISKRFA